jgi:hypothetical protein
MDPVASVERKSGRADVMLVAPSVKLNSKGVMSWSVRLAASGEATVKKPDRLHTGGHVTPEKVVKGLP